MPEGKKSKIQALADPVFDEHLLPGLQTAASHCILTWQREKDRDRDGDREKTSSLLSLPIRALIP